MVEYKCNRCSKLFNKKYDYNYHINRKFKCAENLQKLTEINKNLQNPENNKCICNYCKKEYSNKYVLERHFNTCKIKKEDTNKKEEIYQLLLKQMEENKKHMQIMEENNKKQNEENRKLINELKQLKKENVHEK